MDYEQDYMMRIIKDMVRAIATILLGKTMLRYELPKEREYNETDILCRKLTDMADEGRINDAENLLYEIMDREDENRLEMALCFYLHINEFDDDFLERNHYSREEILQGIENLADRRGIAGLMERCE